MLPLFEFPLIPGHTRIHEGHQGLEPCGSRGKRLGGKRSPTDMPHATVDVRTDNCQTVLLRLTPIHQ